MHSALLFIIVCLSGGLGVGVRYVLNFWKADVRGIVLSTLLVNLVGSFLIGMLWQLERDRKISNRAYIIACAGFLGGLTTFSGYALNLALLTNYADSANSFQIVPFVLYGFLMPFVSVAAVLLGRMTAKIGS